MVTLKKKNKPHIKMEFFIIPNNSAGLKVLKE